MKDHARLRALLQEYHNSAWGWALSCCDGDREVAEDILHNAYLSILEGKATYEGRSTFRTWLFAVIRKMAVSHRTQLLRRFETLIRKLWISPGSREETEAAFYHSEVRNLMQKMLEGLSRRQREVLQLVFYHDLTIEESAQVMGVSVGSARTHYQRGKERIRRLIERTEIRDEY